MHLLARADGRPVTVSDQLRHQIEGALDSARRTAGRFDPTVGPAVTGLRHATHGVIPLCGNASASSSRPAAGWRSVIVTGRSVCIAPGSSLDLGAAMVATALDDIALVATQLTGSGVLLRCGDRVATAGPAPDGQWSVDVDGTAVALAAGESWARLTDPAHIVDPATGTAAQPFWRTVQVVAASCREASTTAVASFVAGRDATRWLSDRQVRAVLQPLDGALVGAGAANLRTGQAA